MGNLIAVVFGNTVALMKGRVRGHYKPSIGKFVPSYTTKRPEAMQAAGQLSMFGDSGEATEAPAPEPLTSEAPPTEPQETAQPDSDELSARDIPIEFAPRVRMNWEHMGTPHGEGWTAVPIRAMQQDKEGRIMPLFDFPTGYTDAPSLFHSSSGGNCELCGTPIKNYYYAKHDQNKWIMVVGSECIQGFSETTGAEMTKQALQQQREDMVMQLRDAWRSISNRDFFMLHPETPESRAIRNRISDLATRLIFQSDIDDTATSKYLSRLHWRRGVEPKPSSAAEITKFANKYGDEIQELLTAANAIKAGENPTPPPNTDDIVAHEKTIAKVRPLLAKMRTLRDKAAALIFEEDFGISSRELERNKNLRYEVNRLDELFDEIGIDHTSDDNAISAWIDRRGPDKSIKFLKQTIEYRLKSISNWAPSFKTDPDLQKGIRSLLKAVNPVAAYTRRSKSGQIRFIGRVLGGTDDASATAIHHEQGAAEKSLRGVAIAFGRKLLLLTRKAA